MKIDQMIDQIYWISKFGRPLRKISSEELYANPALIENPVFFLSTGRCGTEWFTHLLKRDKNNIVFHNPTPNLSVQNKFIHHIYQEDVEPKLMNVISKNLLFTGREQHFRYAYKCKKRYIETNNHITFFANSLVSLFPTAKFVHLYRHPGDFVTSGLNRGWFDKNISATEKMVEPLDQKPWNSYSRIQKIGWVWNETNSFIEEFKKENKERTFAYDFSKRDPNELSHLLEFLNFNFSKKVINKSLGIKKNTQKNITHSAFKNWKIEEREQLKEICGELSEKYNYEL